MSTPALAAIATASDASNTATTITVTKPTGTASGDLLVAVVALRLTGASITPPAGWTLIASGGASSITLATYWKIAGGSEPSNYTFTTTAGRQAAGIARITGANMTTPVDVHSSASGTAGTSLVAASVTPSSAATLLLECFGHGTGSATVTNPGGATSDWSFVCTGAPTAAPVNALAHETLTSATATGTRAATASASGNWAAQLLVIQPPGVISSGFTGWGVPI
jgi:hypothetical protein